MMSSKFNHIITSDRISFFITAKDIIIYIQKTFFLKIHSQTNGHFGCILVLHIVSNVAMNMVVHISSTELI